MMMNDLPMQPDVPADREQVTRLLHQWRDGDKQALNDLMPLVHRQLHSLAARCLSSERGNHTMRATALVNEAYLRLVTSEAGFQDRVHFFAVAARILRHILVDYARTQQRQKRGSGAEVLSLDEALEVGETAASELVDLDAALSRLAEKDPRKGEVVELIYFGGLTYDEAAEALKISAVTVHRELRMAKAYLRRELSGEAATAGSV
jgi:RNA polymerase sigma factor (TIGR02999 family)